MFEALGEKGFEVQCLSHAAAILEKDFPDAITELEASLLDVNIPITEIIGSGGKGNFTQTGGTNNVGGGGSFT